MASDGSSFNLSSSIHADCCHEFGDNPAWTISVSDVAPQFSREPRSHSHFMPSGWPNSSQQYIPRISSYTAKLKMLTYNKEGDGQFTLKIDQGRLFIMLQKRHLQIKNTGYVSILAYGWTSSSPKCITSLLSAGFG